MANQPWLEYQTPQPAQPSGGRVFTLPPNPRQVSQEERAERREDRAERNVERQANIDNERLGREGRNDSFSQLNRLAENYNSDMTVKSYRVAMQQLGLALNTGDGAQSDLALTYAFAKAMDPESVVREAEQGMVTNSQPWFEAAVERARREFGMDEAGTFTPEARLRLRAQVLNSVQQRARVYNTRREYFTRQAEAAGVDPQLVVGEHDANPFVPTVDQFIAQYKQHEAEQQQAQQGQATSTPTEVGDVHTGELVVDVYGNPMPEGFEEVFTPEGVRWINQQTGATIDPAASRAGTFGDSALGQGMSGFNEGASSLLGLPVDAATALVNLIPQGLNAIAGTELPTLDPAKSVLGSQWLRSGMSGLNMIAPPSDDPTNQFIRRTMQSVGASAVPFGATASVPQYLAQLGIGAAGGAGAATAQQVAPGNVLAEVLGEAAGGGAAGLGTLRYAQRNAQRGIEANIPTTQELRDQAGEMYRAAEARGVNASPDQTQTLATTLRQVLADDGRISPGGHISEVYPRAREAIRLTDDYAGNPMTPTQLQTVRRVITDAGRAPEADERRLGRLLTEAFDDWAAPIAPELPAARNVASRYLNAETLEEARELAGARSGQFTGSGFENALRTEYRALDRAGVRGREHFPPEVQRAVEAVSRGTPASNFARNVGRFAPTGPVSMATSFGLPAALGGSMFGGPVGLALGAGTTATSLLGRNAATRMGIRNADIAEMTARNGGPIEQAPLLSPELTALMARMGIAQGSKYLVNEPQR
jgi:hypothetical protein